MLIMPSLSAVHGATIGNMSLAYFFLFVSYIAHASVFYGVVAAIVILFAWLIPRKGFVIPLSLLLALVVIAATVIDRFTYRLYHAHQFAVGIIVLKSGAIEQVMPLSSLEYLFLVLIIVAL